MRKVARSIVRRWTTKGDSKSHFTRLHHKSAGWLLTLNKGLWDVALTKRGKARKFRATNRRSDEQRSIDDDIGASQTP